jgi:DNA-binding GntR family transcriptional regulator
LGGGSRYLERLISSIAEPTVSTWPSISTATLGDRVYSSIRDRILRGELPPGQFVREVDVSQSLGVSRTPVREALARLARDGFVEREARRGYRIPLEPIARLLELYPVLAALEVLAGELAFPKMDPATLAQLRTLNTRCLAAVRKGDVRESIEANHDFHHVLSERCGNTQLCNLLDSLRAQVLRLELWSSEHAEQVDAAIRQHDEIVDAIGRGDLPTALAVLKMNRLQTYTAYYEEIGPGTTTRRKSEVDGRKSEVDGRKSEVGNRKSAKESRKSDVRSQRS